MNPDMPSHPLFYRSTPDALGADHNIGLLIRRVHGLMRRTIDAKTCPLGLTSHQWRPLLLVRYEGIDTPAELARALCIDTGAVTRALDRLEAKGFLQRERASEDRRVVKIILTDLGLSATAQILPRIADTLNLHLQDFSEDEFRMLVSLLKRMITNGERYLAQSRPDKK